MTSQRSLRDRWSLDPGIVFLNHGSFGACPAVVLAEQQRLRSEMEADPVAFLADRLDGLLEATRDRAAAFVDADPEGLVFVPNATTGINAVLRSLDLRPGDELLVTDHGYEACRLAAEHAAEAAGARVVTASIPIPVTGPEDVIDAVLAGTTPATRFALIDHVTSQTALVLPLAEIAAALAAEGIALLVDGAHAPGMIDVAIRDIGALAYSGNWHKWVCTPKGAGFLWVDPEWRDRIDPLVVSHGYAYRKPGKNRLQACFDWSGTDDPTAILSLPVALDALAAMVEGGWPAVRAHNHDLAVAMRARLEAAGLVPAGPPGMIGSMSAHVLTVVDHPEEASAAAERTRARLADRGIVAASTWMRGRPEVLLRVSAHLHTSIDDLDPLLATLPELGADPA